jgi:Arc/MetJ-type ribon-helix-helix transcriptional regulator
VNVEVSAVLARRAREGSLTSAEGHALRATFLFDVGSEYHVMALNTRKIGTTLERSTLTKLDRLVLDGRFRSRSAAIRKAINEMIDRISRKRLARECAKLDPIEERRMAEIGFATDMHEWPEY